MPRPPRWLLFPAIVVVLIIPVLASLAVGTVRRSFPEVEGRIIVPGLSGPVEVLRDRYGVPQVYADNPEDLFEAQGYLQAQDRFYEMDIRRHLAAGRLSELFGASQVEADTFIRTLGWRRVAEAELPLLSSSTRRYLDAYASGVNSYLQGRDAGELSLEYSLLGLQGLDYTPERWTPADSLSWLKVMAWELSANLNQEVELATMTSRVGSARAAQLYPNYPLDGFEPIVTRGAVVGGRFDPAATARPRPAAAGLTSRQLADGAAAFDSIARASRAIPRLVSTPDSAGEAGSNSWAVAGSRTTTGKPILSNDPHLATSIPSIFAQVGLHCRAVSAGCPYDVSGFSLAGVPGIVVGRNAAITWGLTTSYVDTLDLYLEEVRGDRVRQDGSYVPLQVRTERIAVRDEEEPRTIRVRSSRHGPLLSDVDTQLQQLGTAASRGRPPYAVSVAWMALKPGRTMDALLGLNRAGNFAEFRAAAQRLSAPVQNLLYADTAGNIGYQLPGDIPRRGRGTGRAPSPGWDRSYDWRGQLDFAELPYAYNPRSGYLVAANQPVIGAGYPHRLGSDFSYGWRSQQIRDRLQESDRLSLDAAEQLFYDDTIRFAENLVPLLLRVRVRDPWVGEGQRTLVGWDYSASADSAAAAYFHVVVYDILKLTFRDEMPESLWPTGGDRWYGVLTTLLRQPRDPWWDDVTTKDRVETRDDILLAAMTQARKEITSLLARDPDQWRWGNLHQVTLRNQTLGSGGGRLVERLFNRGSYPVDGGDAVVNAMGSDPARGYTVVRGPTMRMLVDLSNLDQSRWVNQSGVSGHAFADHYDDQTELWAANRTWPFVASRPAVEAGAAKRLELAPG